MGRMILRYLNDEKCQIYQVIGDRLKFIEEGHLSELKSKKICDCILGPDQFVWGDLPATVVKFKPTHETFLFSQDTIMEIDGIQYLPARIYNQEIWRQVWYYKSRLDGLIKSLPNIKRVYAELTCIEPNDPSIKWNAGVEYVGSFKNNLVEFDINPGSSVGLDVVDILTLDNFKFLADAPYYSVQKSSYKVLLSMIFIIFISFISPWMNLITKYYFTSVEADATYNNDFDFIITTSKIFPLLEGMMLKSLELNQTKNQLIFLFEEKITSSRELDAKIESYCKKQSCGFNFSNDTLIINMESDR